MRVHKRGWISEGSTWMVKGFGYADWWYSFGVYGMDLRRSSSAERYLLVLGYGISRVLKIMFMKYHFYIQTIDTYELRNDPKVLTIDSIDA